jgi:3-oxoacyl-[acyl-carrier protein] reductase
MKRALVTGGTGSIGSAICHALAAQNIHVYVHSNSRPEAAQLVVSKIQDHGGSAETVLFDVTDAEATAQQLQQITDIAPIQILVNNAGIHADAPLAGMSREQWGKVIDVSLHGFYNVTQPLLLPMMSTRWGRIITISSIAAITGNRGQANYAAAKAGLRGASKSLALEVASRGITVNCVAPGIITSPMITESFPPERIKQLVPMQRAGTPEEVAALVAFLAGEQAGYISGQEISINGAMA